MIDDLSREEILRYSRHLMIPEVGLEGQRKLKHSSVLIVGAGGLGSPVGLYLAAAGIGRIGLVDPDLVELSNLQRQVLHGTNTLGTPKVESARQHMLDLNPAIQVDVHHTTFCAENALDISKSYDILVDGTDNLPTRYLINDVCVLTRKAFVFGAVYRFDGQVSLFDSQKGPCYRCVFKDPPPPEIVPTCANSGVFGIMPGIVGTLQAAETIKAILGIGESLAGKLLLINALDITFQTIHLQKDPQCRICSEHPTITSLKDVDGYRSSSTGNHAPAEDITPRQLADRLAIGDKLHIIDVRQPHEAEISNLPGAELIPFDTLPENLAKMNQEDEIVLFCRTGVRSAQAQRLLLGAGFKHVLNLKGGINAWAQDVDPTLKQY